MKDEGCVCFLVYDVKVVNTKQTTTTYVTSVPACRKTLRAENNNRYFDLKHLKICAHLNISYIFLYVVFRGHSRTP